MSTRPQPTVSGIVLIVDDAEASVAALEIALSDIPGVTVQLVSSAVGAAGILKDAGAQVRAVVTDLQMPRMDGYELIRLMRADPRYARTPIVVVSGATDPAAAARSIESGANAFFAKPFSPGAVRRKVEQLLNEDTVS